MDNASNKSFCDAPWNLLRVEMDGNCYSCSSAYVKDCYSFGSIFDMDFNEIWNGQSARNFRQDKFNGEYKYCKKQDCHLFASDGSFYSRPINVSESGYIADFPNVVSLSYDFSCSERCVFCRDKIDVLDSETAKKWDSIVDSKIIPLLSNVKLLEITCSGELLSSNHSRNVLKRIVSVYPNIKLKLFSNGLHFNEENLKELGIINNLEEVCISLHSCTPKTYKKIFRTNNFEKVKKNLYYISNLKKQGLLNSFNIQFVINKFNYKEIKPFIKLVNSLGANPVFTYVSDTTNTEFVKNPYNWAVFKQNHYLYNNFVSILNDKFVRSYLPDFLKELKKVNSFKIIKNLYMYFLYKIGKRRDCCGK